MIKNLFNIYKRSSLVKDNLILFISGIGMGLFVFLYHFYTGRVLGPAGYAVIGVAQSIVYIFNIPLTTIQTAISKFVADFKTKNKFGEINYLFKSSIKKIFIYGFIALILFLIFSPFIASYLKVNVLHLILLAPFIVFILLVAANRGMLQGLQKFKDFGINLMAEGTSKFFLAVLLVVIGFSINGAIGAIVLSYIVAFFAGYYPIKKFMSKKIKKFNTKGVYKYSIPTFLMLIGLTALYNIDVLLVKHFFIDVDAGRYVAISTLGKILFFGSYSITQVMFPKVSELYSRKKPYKHLLYKSLLMMLIFLIPVTLFYFLFPKFIINIVYGAAYLNAANLLGWFAIIMGLFALIYTIAFYNLSINKNKFLIILFLFNLLEIILIYLFHNTLTQIVTILIILMLLLFIIMILQVVISKDGKTLYNNTRL